MIYLNIMNLYILNWLNNLNLKWNLRRIVRKRKRDVFEEKISSIESAENEISDEVDEDELVQYIVILYQRILNFIGILISLKPQR